MVTFPPALMAPDAVDVELTARRMEAVDRLVEIGMALTEALQRQVLEPDAPRVFTGDLALAFSRIARAVRLSVLLAQRLEDGLPAPQASDERAKADDAAAEPAERFDEAEDERADAEWGERADREADESVWLTRPISALAAQICRDLDAPYDAALWEDGEQHWPRGNPSPSHAFGAGPSLSRRERDFRLRGDERGYVSADERRPP